MCKKCIKHPENRNTRYCDDWWDDIPHGGYKADRKLREEQSKQQDRDRPKRPEADLSWED